MRGQVRDLERQLHQTRWEVSYIGAAVPGKTVYTQTDLSDAEATLSLCQVLPLAGGRIFLTSVSASSTLPVQFFSVTEMWLSRLLAIAQLPC